MEKMVESVQAYNKECEGCKRWHKNTMISFTFPGDEAIHDFFLTEDQAEHLKKMLADKKCGEDLELIEKEDKDITLQQYLDGMSKMTIGQRILRIDEWIFNHGDV